MRFAPQHLENAYCKICDVFIQPNMNVLNKTSQTYYEHLIHSSHISIKLGKGCLKSLVHTFIPMYYTNSTNDLIDELKDLNFPNYNAFWNYDDGEPPKKPKDDLIFCSEEERNPKKKDN